MGLFLRWKISWNKEEPGSSCEMSSFEISLKDMGHVSHEGHTCCHTKFRIQWWQNICTVSTSSDGGWPLCVWSQPFQHSSKKKSKIRRLRKVLQSPFMLSSPNTMHQWGGKKGQSYSRPATSMRLNKWALVWSYSSMIYRWRLLETTTVTLVMWKLWHSW